MAANAAAAGEEIYGTWRLVSNTRTVVGSSKTEDLFGKSPRGFINYGRDGRVMVLIVRDRRPKAAAVEKMTDRERLDLFNSMLAYAGTYTFDGKMVTHHVELSWNEIFNGTELPRNVTITGRRLILTTKPGPNALDGKLSVSTLTWEKVDERASSINFTIMLYRVNSSFKVFFPNIPLKESAKVQGKTPTMSR